jgi:hypothetical protein
MPRWFKTLYAKIAVSLLLLLGLLTALEVGLMYFFWNRATASVEQQAHWGLAGRIAARMGPALGGAVDYWGLQQVAKSFTDLNPYIDIYPLDGQGTVVADFAEEGRPPPRGVMVDLAPLRRFQEPGGKAHIPLLGDDPRQARRRGPFSAASIDLNGRPGFVYVLLSNPRHRRLASLSQEDGAFRGLLLASGVPLLGVALLGLAVFRTLTRRFQGIITVIGRYEGGELDARLDLRRPGGDELAALALAVNRMMETIAGSITALQEKDRLQPVLVGEGGDQGRYDFRAYHSQRGRCPHPDLLLRVLERLERGRYGFHAYHTQHSRNTLTGLQIQVPQGLDEAVHAYRSQRCLRMPADLLLRVLERLDEGRHSLPRIGADLAQRPHRFPPDLLVLERLDQGWHRLPRIGTDLAQRQRRIPPDPPIVVGEGRDEGLGGLRHFLLGHWDYSPGDLGGRGRESPAAPPSPTACDRRRRRKCRQNHFVP